MKLQWFKVGVSGCGKYLYYFSNDGRYESRYITGSWMSSGTAEQALLLWKHMYRHMYDNAVAIMAYNGQNVPVV